MSGGWHAYPALWQEIYDTLRDAEPELVLAGGALRDWDNGRPAKDLDFFWRNADEKVVWKIAQRARDLGYIVPAPDTDEGRLLGRNDEGRSMDEGQVQNTWIFHHPDPVMLPVNLIHMNAGFATPQKIIGRFDFGICQIGAKGIQIWRSEAYLYDQERRTFTLTDERTGLKRERSIERYQRLLEKYPGWRMIDPWELARRFAGVEDPSAEERAEAGEMEF